ncbi:myocardin-related transcription factor A-like isoform X2 [Odontesthes bonariensis]|uniref:myocardin-related transcription factor A-like isoform X2 n=1 Tax=Odontesthes bonariensis TaxID=219752 RepID=UPI003F58C9A3
MLDHLQRVNINPAHFRPQPISSSMDERDIRFELERQACQSLRKVLQLKLQQRKTREELVSQGIMPPLKSSAAFHEQRRSLERARTEDYLKRKIRSRPERNKLIRMHILEETATEPLLQVKQLQLKRARLADDLNDKIAHRPGPMELIQKNILPVHSRIKEAIIETQFPKAAGENSSCDEDSNDSLSPGPVSLDYPLGPGAVRSPTEKLAGSSIQSPTQAPPPALHFPSIAGSLTALKLTNRTAASSAQRTGANSDIKPQPKPNSDRLSLRHKKTKDNKPKIKKLKYHQYIPPDQKGDKEPPPHLDSSYAKILQQQQLFLQLQILSQQQQHYNYHTILPAPPKDPKPSSSSNSMSTSSPPRPAAAPSPVLSDQLNYICLGSAPLAGTKAASVHPNLDGMKVAELKSELKLRSLPVSGTKNNLIERLKTYQELNRGGDTTPSPTAGGTTGPGPEGGGGRSSKKAETATTNNGALQEEQFQPRQASSRIGTPERLKRCVVGNIKPRSSTPAPVSPKGIRFNSNLLGELISSPFTELSLQPSSVAVHVKEEPPCSTQAPCQFSLKSASLQKHCFASSPAPSSTTAASLVTIDKDKMLQEKDKQIAELTRRLMQKQRLVEVLKMQLELGTREGRAPEPLILRRVKEEPPDHEPFAPQVSSLSSEMDANELTVKQEAVEIEIGGSEPSVQSSDAHGLLQSFTQNQVAQDQTHLQLKPERKGVQKKQELVCLHQPALQLAQQQAIQRLLQRQHNIQNHIQMSEPQQKLCLQRQKKSQKALPKQHEQQKQRLAAQQKQQQSGPMQPKQSCNVRQSKQQQIQIQTKIHLNQQQMARTDLEPTSHSTPSFPPELLKSDLPPAAVGDGNDNRFLISLTNHITGDERADASEGKATNHIALQRLHSTPAELPSIFPAQVTRSKQRAGFLKQLDSKMQNGALQLSAQQPQQGAAHCLSAPPSLHPFFKDQQPAPTRQNSSSPPAQTEMCADLDALLSPPSPASVRTAASQPDDKDPQNQDDFIDIILQAGGMSTTFGPAPDPSLDHLNPNSSASSPTPSPLHLLLSSPIAASGDLPQSACSPQHTTDEKQHLGICTNGRLEDFLESTTGKPILGVEPGGLLTLIDDLHSQLLCTPSILDRAPSPMDTFEMAGEGGQGLDSTDWLDLNMGEERDEESPTLAPLGPQTPLSVFSTDFLDSSDLHIHWGSCP